MSAVPDELAIHKVTESLNPSFMFRVQTNRRRFLWQAAATLAVARCGFAQSARPLQIGVTDWNLNLGAQPEAVVKAQQLGFSGVQISFGRKLVDGKLPVDRPDILAHYRELAKQHAVTIDGTCVDRLHDNGLKSDPLALRWVSDSIRLTREVGSQILLLPFFGRWALKNDQEISYTGSALRELAPEAEKAGVILGVEDTISAEENTRILELARSSSVRVYYDVGNSTIAGFNPVDEIRMLGKDKICQFHFKDNPHLLGEGAIAFEPIVGAIREIGWSGWVNLETDACPGSFDSDLRHNLSYIRQMIANR